MKRIIALALSLVTVMSLAACGGKTSGSDNSAAASGGSGDGKVYKITYANTVADSNPQAINAKYMADRMKELSNGRIEMTVFNNNKLGAFSDCFQQMQQPNGTVQMGDVSSASVTQFSDLYTPFALPFLFSSKEQSFVIYCVSTVFINGEKTAY